MSNPSVNATARLHTAVRALPQTLRLSKNPLPPLDRRSGPRHYQRNSVAAERSPMPSFRPVDRHLKSIAVDFVAQLPSGFGWAP
jgi:hypothetical protein